MFTWIKKLLLQAEYATLKAKQDALDMEIASVKAIKERGEAELKEVEQAFVTWMNKTYPSDVRTAMLEKKLGLANNPAAGRVLKKNGS